MLQCPRCGRHYAADAQTCPEDGTPLRAEATVAFRAADDPLLGRALDGKYRLDELLGEGGMGTVYRATHLLIDRPVAVKVLNPRLVTDAAAKERFRREARAAGRLRHPNAVAVTDFGETAEGLVYIVMELLEGTSLRDVLAAEAPLDAARAASVMSQVAGAVAAAHESGVIHRDLKPANIFLVEREAAQPLVKVLDFGIAKLGADALEEGEAHTLTQTGVMIGTPRYMSPEQCDGAKLTPASDVYSLGIILYEMLTGMTPFAGSSPLSVALQHSAKPPRRPSDILASVPEELERVVLHALAKQPADRPADAGEFRRELLAAWEGAELNGASADGKSPSAARGESDVVSAAALVFDVEGLREKRAAALAPRDTTLLTGKVGRPTLLANSHDTSEEPAPPAFSRISVRLRRRWGWSRRLRRPKVLALVGVALLALVVGVAAFFGRGDSGAQTASATANANTNPTPSPEPTPSTTPSPAEDPNAKKKPTDKRPRRTTRPKKKENFIKRAAKKIFKNPF